MPPVPLLLVFVLDPQTELEVESTSLSSVSQAVAEPDVQPVRRAKTRSARFSELLIARQADLLHVDVEEELVLLEEESEAAPHESNPHSTSVPSATRTTKSLRPVVVSLTIEIILPAASLIMVYPSLLEELLEEDPEQSVPEQLAAELALHPPRKATSPGQHDSAEALGRLTALNGRRA